MAKNLAIDATEENYSECVRYSSLVREMFGNKTFIFENLEQALYSLPALKIKALNQAFGLFEAEDYDVDCQSFYYPALKDLAEADDQYMFLTETYIKYIQNLDAYTLDYDLECPSIDLILIEATPLPARAKNALIRYKIKTVGDLRRKTLKELMRIRNIGQDTASEIQRIMKETYGIILD